MVNKKMTSPILLILIGAAAVLLIMAIYHMVMGALSTQTKLSCHITAGSKTEYCAYLRTTPGMLGETNEILVGPDSSRGVVRKVDSSFSVSDIRTEWSGSDQLTISTSEEAIIMQPSLYIDTR